ncbi:unnamed protein product [Effrenium voratum]|nr:unnamed protein product [Effrenium voratum]
MPTYADGFPLAYAEESNMLDTYDEASGQKQYAMWNFCNNHDNWRLQAMTSTRHLLLCLVVITFWPGIPLHYAGDEQNLGSPGSALDGWSREELGSSLAWQAVTVTPSGNPADGDNFDMTAPNYLFIARLNALRRSYFGDFGREECDKLVLPESPIPDVLAFSRGCTEERAASWWWPTSTAPPSAPLACAANGPRVPSCRTPWSQRIHWHSSLVRTGKSPYSCGHCSRWSSRLRP